MQSQVHCYGTNRELRIHFKFYLHNLNLQCISCVPNTLCYLTLMHAGPATMLLPAKPPNMLCVKGFPHLFHCFVNFKATEGELVGWGLKLPRDAVCAGALPVTEARGLGGTEQAGVVSQAGLVLCGQLKILHLQRAHGKVAAFL